MADMPRDDSGRQFLLGYIEMLKGEMACLQQQLDRYAEDFRALLTADDTPARLHAGRTPRLSRANRDRRDIPSYIAEVSSLCQEIAQRLGQTPAYQTALAGFAREALAEQHQQEIIASDANEQTALQHTPISGSCTNSQCLPLASRIFALAEYAASLTNTPFAGQASFSLSHAELGDLLRDETANPSDRELVGVLLQLIAEKEEKKR